MLIQRTDADVHIDRPTACSVLSVPDLMALAAQEQLQRSWLYQAAPLAKRAVSAVFVVLCWNRPVVSVNSRLLWPFGRLACAPHCGSLLPGQFAAGPWVALCQAASALLTKAVTNI